MLVYVLQIAAIPFLALILKPNFDEKRSRSRLYVVAIACLLLLVSAARSIAVGADTEQFCRAYLRIGIEGFFSFDIERYEPLFILLCIALNRITSNYQVLIMVASAISLIPIARLIYIKSKDIPFSFFLYITLNIYFGSMNAMRQAMALGIIAITIPRLLDGKTFLYIASVVVAALFHQSALIALLLVPLSKLKFGKTALLAYVAASTLAFFSSTQVSNIVAGLLGRKELYAEAFMGSNYFGALFQALVVFSCCLLCANYFVYGKRVGKEGKSDSLYMHAMMLWLFFSIFSMKVEIVGRLGIYFSLFAILAIPEAVERVPKGERHIVRGLTYVAFLTYFIVICVARPEWFGVIPYTFDFGHFWMS